MLAQKSYTKHLISTIKTTPIANAQSLLAEYATQVREQEPLLIAGLGNPGDKYAKTRHNIGFIIIDRLCACLGLGLETSSRFCAHIASLTPHIYITKPQTFMNRSGEAIAAIASFYKIKHFCIAHDELDLPLGAIRYKCGGSSGGHNGLKSIDSALHRQDYTRLRFGIKESLQESQASKQKQVIDFVLGDFTLPEKQLLELVDESVRGLLFFIITRDFSALQSHFTISKPKDSSHANAPKSTLESKLDSKIKLDSSANPTSRASLESSLPKVDSSARDSKGD